MENKKCLKPPTSIYIYPSKYHDKYHTPTCYFIVIGTNLDLANELGLHPTKMASSASGIAAGAVVSSGRMEPRLGKPPEKSRFFATEMRNSYGDDRMALHYKPSSYLGCLHCRLNSHMYIIEGSLEVKLPTIWTDEKQSSEEAERRGRLEERRVEENE